MVIRPPRGIRLTSKYAYKGMDITMDVYDKIHFVVELPAKEDGSTFDDAYRAFVKSWTLTSVQAPATLMWSESHAFIVDEYRRENLAETR